MAIRTRRINPTSLRNLNVYIRDLPKEVSKTGSRAIRDGAKLFAEALKEAIYNQEYASSYAPLNPDYVLRKITESKVSDYPAYWLFDMELVNAIEVTRKDTSKGNMSYVVGFNHETHSHAKIPNSELAMMLEYGYGVPARPVIEPTWEEYGDIIRKEVRRIFEADWHKKKFRG